MFLRNVTLVIFGFMACICRRDEVYPFAINVEFFQRDDQMLQISDAYHKSVLEDKEVPTPSC